jgi:cell division septum initiation protein DivIVA
MLKKTEFGEDINMIDQAEVKERIEAILKKLQVLKRRISELRAHFEEIQKSRAEGDSTAFHCEECGGAIEPGQEVEAKNFSETTRHYHKDCFQKIWLQ